MGRRRVRPHRTATYGIARGWRQRAILDSLLAGERLGVLTHPGRQTPTPPGGMSLGAWQAFMTRLMTAGYRLEWEGDHFGRFTFRLIGGDALAAESGNGQHGSSQGGEN